MKRTEMTVSQMIAGILSVLCLIAGLVLTILDAENVLNNAAVVEDIMDFLFWLFTGIAFWKKGSLFPIFCFVRCALSFVLIFA